MQNVRPADDPRNSFAYFWKNILRLAIYVVGTSWLLAVTSGGWQVGIGLLGAILICSELAFVVLKKLRSLPESLTENYGESDPTTDELPIVEGSSHMQPSKVLERSIKLSSNEKVVRDTRAHGFALFKALWLPFLSLVLVGVGLLNDVFVNAPWVWAVIAGVVLTFAWWRRQGLWKAIKDQPFLTFVMLIIIGLVVTATIILPGFPWPRVFIVVAVLYWGLSRFYYWKNSRYALTYTRAIIAHWTPIWFFGATRVDFIPVDSIKQVSGGKSLGERLLRLDCGSVELQTESETDLMFQTEMRHVPDHKEFQSLAWEMRNHQLGRGRRWR